MRSFQGNKCKQDVIHISGETGVGGGGVEMSPYRLEQGKTHKLNLGNNDNFYNFRI